MVPWNDSEPLAEIATNAVAEERIPVMIFRRETRDDHRRLAFALAYQGAKVVACPVCSSTDTPAHLRRQRPDYWFSINAPRECAACKTVFVPQASALLRIVTLAIGILFVVFSLLLLLVPAVAALASEGWALRSLFNGVGGAVTVVFGVYVVITAVRSGATRVLRNDNDVSSGRATT